ncbi:MAG: LON peptidase substrate-binding domain-containing protein [Phycisphaeraceae bacterium]|nr:LON peptidase substrate-binding domain-containing protein [Phycisphaeraceae bacterium]MCB9847050.1 LON peptidase substrate-binding domain-containing protein [Phycisphaeraceae bacterium]
MAGRPETVRVNFGKPIPIFPLPSVPLLPHAVAPMHIFEDRYRQMVEHALDSSGQIAMAVFQDDDWKKDYHGRPAIRTCVCLGQIVQHERLADGRYNILLQGVCRARIRREFKPEEGLLYRRGLLAPIGPTTKSEETALEGDLPEMLDARRRITDLLSEPPLDQLTAAESVCSCLSDLDTPAPAVLELIGVSIITNDKTRYDLLCEGDIDRRVDLIETELRTIRDLIRRAEPQLDPEAPKGTHNN